MLSLGAEPQDCKFRNVSAENAIQIRTDSLSNVGPA
jgi:hypothetical protein